MTEDELKATAAQIWLPTGKDAEITLLRAEIERLRTALEELQKLGEQGMEPSYTKWLTFHDKVAEVARKALANEQP